jgi:hypothetical protein
MKPLWYKSKSGIKCAIHKKWDGMDCKSFLQMALWVFKGILTETPLEVWDSENCIPLPDVKPGYVWDPVASKTMDLWC